MTSRTVAYLERTALQNFPFAIGTVALAAADQSRRKEVARVKVPTEDACSWRVTMAPILFNEIMIGGIEDFTSGLPNQPRGLLTWGADGTFNTAIIDWPCGGGNLTVWGDYVSLTAIIPNTWIASGASPPSSVTCGGQIVPGEIAGSLRPTFTQYTGLVVGGAFSAFLPVPAFARSFRWHQQINTGASTPVPISWFGVLDSLGATVSQTTPDGPYTSSESTWPGADGITLSPSTRFLTFENRLGIGLGSLSMFIEYCLDLG